MNLAKTRVAKLLLLSGLSCLLWAGAARAADLTPQQKAEMRSLYDKATRAYDVGKYAEAIEDYQKAYEIGGDPPMLYNIAQSYRLNNQPGEAVRFYKRYLQRAPSARNREDVERKIAEQEKIMEEQKKLQPPPPPVVPAPATPAPTTTTPAPAPPTVGPPSPQPIIPPPTTETPGTTPAPTMPVEEPSRTRTIVGWSLIGAGAVGGVLAGVFGAKAKDRSDSLTSMSKMNGAVEFDPTLEKQGKDAQLYMIISAAAGGAAAITGVILLLTGGSSGEAPAESAPVSSARATITPWLGGGVVGAGADFRF
jgi:tetratricopeptide (TPR) repeat protein